MKNLILIYLVTFGLIAKAQYFQVIGSSYNSMDPIEDSSQQWVDVSMANRTYYADSIEIFIYNYASFHTNNPIRKVVFKQILASASKDTLIKDSKTGKWKDSSFVTTVGFLKDSGGWFQLRYRIYLTIPPHFPTGKFMITTLFGDTTQGYGIIGTPLGLSSEQTTESPEISQYFYYDTQGNELKDAQNFSGIYIRKDIYKNGSSKTTKIAQF